MATKTEMTALAKALQENAKLLSQLVASQEALKVRNHELEGKLHSFQLQVQEKQLELETVTQVLQSKVEDLQKQVKDKQQALTNMSHSFKEAGIHIDGLESKLLASQSKASDNECTVQTPQAAQRFGVIKYKDLEKHDGLLGCGGFGVVILVEETKSGNKFAMKALSKGLVVDESLEQNVMRERDVMMICNSYWIIRLYETYSTHEYLYFLMELALGGDLKRVYKENPHLFGHLACARFYLAGVVLALEHLHGKKIACRDVKPENVLLTEQGMVKLADMGLAKRIDGKTYTKCGTPSYMAPEMWDRSGHDHSVDWWALGVLAGFLMKGRADVACQDLVRVLCDRNAQARLGGALNIRSHVFFSGFAWSDMESLAMPPPYVPVPVKPLRDGEVEDSLPSFLPYEGDGVGLDNFATSS